MSASSPASEAGLLGQIAVACVLLAIASLGVWVVVFLYRAHMLRQQRRRAAAEEELTAIVLDQLSGYKAAALKLNLLQDWQRDVLLQVLQSLIDQTKGRDQANLIRILHDAGFHTTALEQVGTARSPAARQGACGVLGYFEDDKSIAALRRALDDTDPAVRLTAGLALLRKDRIDSLEDFLAKLRFNPEDPPLVLAEIFQRLPERLHPEALRLIDEQRLPPEWLRMLALALARRQIFAAFDAIARLRHSPLPRVRSASWVALNELGDPRAGDFVLDGLADPVADVRHVAGVCAGKLGGPEVLPALKRMASEGGWWDRYHAATALAGHGAAGREELTRLAADAAPDSPARQAWNDLPKGGNDGR
jgi:HEAT repeat protein